MLSMARLNRGEEYQRTSWPRRTSSRAIGKPGFTCPVKGIGANRYLISVQGRRRRLQGAYRAALWGQVFIVRRGVRSSLVRSGSGLRLFGKKETGKCGVRSSFVRETRDLTPNRTNVET